ncbi:MAG TPA: DUF2938 domain-containing protein [Anaerolineales bacterium]|nr:DUF2938 domain-containing protein [Anaerolineales bacterium]
MSNVLFPFVSVVVMGLGATLTFDLWVLFLRHVFKIPAANICLVGRWLRYMPEGVFKHSNLASAPPKSAECVIGWVAHYLIGVLFAAAFVAIAGSSWLQRPTLLPALGFGIVTVLAPLFIMQPLFGLGIAASRTSNPAQARLRSLMNHTVFGAGLYLFGAGLSWVR